MMARLSITLLAIIVIILSVTSPNEACRLLNADENLAKIEKMVYDKLHLQVLQKNSVPPPGPNGCSYVKGSSNPCKSN